MNRTELAALLDSARGSLRALFGVLPNDKLEFLLNAAARELCAPSGATVLRPSGEAADTVDMLNAAVKLITSNALEQRILARFANALPGEFELKHAANLAAAPEYLQAFAKVLVRGCGGEALLRLRPEWLTNPPPSNIFADGDMESIRAAIAANDPFGSGRILRYINGNFSQVKLPDMRTADEFYGFAQVREIFSGHFSAFAIGRSVPPLFITSLPGLGKTAMTIAYTLANPELTLILPEPSALEHGLDALFRALGRRSDRRFVVFFDDIDPREVNWYEFRICVGGSFAMPENISIAIAANYAFQPNVLSRGRSIPFPIFDEIRCQEMVADYLIHHRLRNPDPNLISVMAADYVEEFGQKKFTELSPRSLIRYLRAYIESPAKRKSMLDASHQNLIVRPDAQLFYEQNIKMMRALYGESYIEEILKEKLSKLGE